MSEFPPDWGRMGRPAPRTGSSFIDQSFIYVYFSQHCLLFTGVNLFLHLLRCKAPGLTHQDHFGLFKAAAVNGIAPRIDRSDAKTSKASSGLSTRSCLWQVRICVEILSAWATHESWRNLSQKKKRNIRRYQAQEPLFYAMPPTRTITKHVQVSYGQTWLNVCQIQKGNLTFLDSKNHQGFDETPWTTHNHLTLTGSNLQSWRIWKLLYTSKDHKIHLSKLSFVNVQTMV